MSPARRHRLTGLTVFNRANWEAETAGRSSDGLPNERSTLKPEMVLSELDFLAFWPKGSRSFAGPKDLRFDGDRKSNQDSVSNGRAFLSGNSWSR